MSSAPLRLLAATLVIGLVAGVAIVQLFPGVNALEQAAVSPVEPVIVVQTPETVTSPTADGVTIDDTATTSQTAALSQAAVDEGIEFVTRDRLEAELPEAVVDLLIERDAILLEEVPVDVP